MTNYILIDANTRAPVPLPYETTITDEGFDGCCSLKDFSDPNDQWPDGLVWWWSKQNNGTWHFRKPADFGLALITEEQFMAEQEAVATGVWDFLSECD